MQKPSRKCRSSICSTKYVVDCCISEPDIHVVTSHQVCYSYTRGAHYSIIHVTVSNPRTDDVAINHQVCSNKSSRVSVYGPKEDVCSWPRCFEYTVVMVVAISFVDRNGIKGYDVMSAEVWRTVTGQITVKYDRFLPWFRGSLYCNIV